MAAAAAVMGLRTLGLGGTDGTSRCINVTCQLLVIVDVILVATGATFIGAASTRGCTSSGTIASTRMSDRSGICFTGASHRVLAEILKYHLLTL
jgi:hypothetical protein